MVAEIVLVVEDSMVRASSPLADEVGEDRIRSRRIVFVRSALWIALLVLSVSFPVIGIVAALYVIAISYKKSSLMSGILTIIVLTVLFSVANASKIIASDWIWYTDHYRALQYTPFPTYFDINIDGVVASPTEPVFYVIMKVVSVLSGANVPALAWAVTVLIYCPVGIAALIAARQFTRRASATITAVAGAMICGLTFTLSTQLVRQEIAAAFIALGIVLVSTRRTWLGVFFLLMAVGVHNSAAIPDLAFGLAVLLRSPSNDRARVWQVLSILAAFAFLGAALATYAGATGIEGKNDGAVSLTTVLLDAGLILLYFLTSARLNGSYSRGEFTGGDIQAVNLLRGNRSHTYSCQFAPVLPVGQAAMEERESATVTGHADYVVNRAAVENSSRLIGTVSLLLPGLVGLILGVSSLPLLFLRLYFYLEMGRALILCIVVAWLLNRSSYRLLLAGVIIPLAFIYLGLRIQNSPFQYGVRPLELLFQSPWITT